MRSSHLLGNSRAGLVSSTVLLRIEFTATDASTPMRALLPHVSTLTSSAQTSYPSLRRKRQSSYIPLRLLCCQSGALPAFGDGKTSYPSLCRKKQSLYIPFFLLCRQSRGFAGFLEHAGNTPAVSCVGIWTRRYISVALFLRSLWAGVTRYPCPVEPGLSS